MYTPIALPEYKFHPREPHAPDSKTGSSLTGIPKPEQAQQSLLLENSSITVPQTSIKISLGEPHHIIEKVPTEQNQEPASAIGQVAQSLVMATQFRKGKITEATGTIDQFSEETQSAIKDARRTIWEQTGYIPPLAGGSEIIGKPGFRWKRELSEDGRKLYQHLLMEMGDVHLLPMHAARDNYNLQAALEELRKHGLLDESNPQLIRIIHQKLQ